MINIQKQIQSKTVEALTAMFSAVRSPAGFHLVQFNLNKRKDPIVERALKDAIAYMLSTGDLLLKLDTADGDKWWLASRGAPVDSMDRAIPCVTVRTTPEVRQSMFILVESESLASATEPVDIPVAAPLVPSVSETPTSWAPDKDASCDKNILSLVQYYYSRTERLYANYDFIESKLPDVKPAVLKLRLSVLASKSDIRPVHFLGRPLSAVVYLPGDAPCPVGYELAKLQEPKVRSKPKAKAPPEVKEENVEGTVLDNAASLESDSEQDTDSEALPHITLADNVEVVWSIDSRGTLACSDAVNDTWILTLSPRHTASLSAFLGKVNQATIDPTE